LQGERHLIIEDEPLIALDLQATIERETRVVLAHTMVEALRYADYGSQSAGVRDFRLGSNNADPVCEALTRRDVPLIFTGLSGALLERWAATPVEPKPAAPETVTGALKIRAFAGTRNIREIATRRRRPEACPNRASNM
jgi:hypothetical protein